MRHRRRLRRLQPELDFEVLQRLLGHLVAHAIFGLDLGDAFLRQIGGHAHLAAVLIDSLLDDAFDLPEIGRQAHVEGLRELRDLGFGGAHLQFGVVLLDALAQLDQLFVRVLDFFQAVAVRGFVHQQLLLVRPELLFGFLQLQREFRRRRPIARLEVRLGLGFELLHVRAVG